MLENKDPLFSWNGLDQVPLLLPALAFLLGTIVPVSTGEVPSLVLLMSGSSLGVLALWWYRTERFLPFSLCHLIGFFALGWFFLVMAQENRQREQSHLMPFMKEGITPEWRADLERDAEEYPDRVVLMLQLESVEHLGRNQKLNSRCRLVVHCRDNCSTAKDLITGSRVRFRTALFYPRNYSNPGMFDYRAYLERQNILLIGTLKSPFQLERIEGEYGATVRRYSASIRRSFTRYLQIRLSRYGADGQRASAILEGLLFGRRERMDAEVEGLFQKTGTYHIFVVSGFNTTLIAVFLVWIIGFLPYSRFLVIPLVSVALCSYAIMADMNVPVIRATILSLLVLVAHTLWRKVHLLNSLALTVILILIIWPESAHDTSFQLTYVACLAIACIAVPLTQQWLNPFRTAFSRLFVPNTALLNRGRAQRWARRLRFELELTVEYATRPLGTRQEVAGQYLAKLISIFGGVAYYLAGVLMVSLAIHLFMAPIMAVLFHRAILASAMANLVVVPIMTLLLLSSLSMGLLLMLIQWSWEPWIQSTVWICRWVIDTLQTFSHWRYWHWWVPTPPAYWVWLYFALWIPVLLPFQRKIRCGFLALALFILPSFFWSPFPMVHQKGQLEVWFFDVGHGDSTLFLFPDGRTMLIDGGGNWRPPEENDPENEISTARFDIGEDVVSPALWKLRVRKLDYVLLTHPERDHAGGLEAILSNFPVGELLGPAPADRWQGLVPELSETARQKGLAWRGLLRGEALAIGGVDLQVLNPPTSLLGPHSRVNNRSVVLHGRYGGETLLLTGDVERMTEFDLVRECPGLRADILKVPHHGSDTSSTPAFLECVQPKYAVISCSDSRSSLRPSSVVLERLKERGAQILQTAQAGAVHATLSLAGIRVESYLLNREEE